MFCSKCGAENGDTNAFCKNCGKHLQDGLISPFRSNYATITSVQTPPAQPVTHTPNKGCVGKLVAVVIAMVVLAGLGVVGKWVLDNILHNPVKDFTSAIIAQDYLGAHEIYEKRIGDNDGYLKSIEELLTTQLYSIEADLTAGTINYDFAIGQINGIQDLGILNYSDIETVISRIAEFGRGNTVGNIVNEGMVAERDGWVYYANDSDDNKLYKVRTDGTDKIKLNNDCVGNLNVLDGWVYYTNISENYTLYKVRTDGTGRTRLNEDESGYLNVVNGWVYYTNGIEVGHPYKIRTDGTDRTKLNDDEISDLNVVDSWAYYYNDNDNKLYKVRIDGTDRTKLNDDEGWYINVVDGWVYYRNNSDHSMLYKIRTDGTERTKIADDEGRYLNVADGWAYYSNSSDNGMLYKIRTDGTNKTKLNEYNFRTINVVDDWVYYYSYQLDNDKLYKMRTDGTGRQRVD